jgi:GT2 family glycosyltransferase
MDKVSIIIVTYNNKELFKNYFNELYIKTDYKNKEFIIIDNSSCKDYVSKEIKKQNYKNTRVMRTNKNLGWGGACNFGAKKATGKLIIFLNDDIKPYTKNWLSILVKTYNNLNKNRKNKLFVVPNIINLENGKKLRDVEKNISKKYFGKENLYYFCSHLKK